MKIAQIRSIISTLNWARREFTGGTREENKRTQLPDILAPHIEKVKALEIPARFKRDIENRDDALKYAGKVIDRWLDNQLTIPQEERIVQLRNLLVTDFGDDGENVMVYSKGYTVETLKVKLEESGNPFADIVEVPDEDVQYYIFEPLHIEPKHATPTLVA